MVEFFLACDTYFGLFLPVASVYLCINFNNVLQDVGSNQQPSKVKKLPSFLEFNYSIFITILPICDLNLWLLNNHKLDSAKQLNHLTCIIILSTSSSQHSQIYYALSIDKITNLSSVSHSFTFELWLWYFFLLSS